MKFSRLVYSALGMGVLLSGTPGCKRFMSAEARARKAPAIELSPLPPLPPVDPLPARRREVERLQHRERQQRQVRERLDMLTTKLDRLFRADAVSVGRSVGLDTVVKSLESAPETVKVTRLVSIENRWTVEITTGEKPDEPEPRPSQLFAEALRLSVPTGSTVEYVRDWQGGVGSFILGFTYPARVNRSADAPRAPLPEDRLPAALLLDPVLPEGADAVEGRPVITSPEIAPGAVVATDSAAGEAGGAPAGDGGVGSSGDAAPSAAPTAAASEAPSAAASEAPSAGGVAPDAGPVAAVPDADAELLALEAKIATLSERVDERTLIEDRRVLSEVEGALDLLDKRRLARLRNGTLRLGAVDVERIAEVAGLRGGVVKSEGASRLGVLHAETVVLTGQGALGTLVSVFEAIDTAGALVGNLELGALEGGDWSLRVDLHLLGR